MINNIKVSKLAIFLIVILKCIFIYFRFQSTDHQIGFAEKHKKKSNYFKCNHCPFHTRHSLEHQGSGTVRLFDCQKCDFVTKWKNALKRHELVHTRLDKVGSFGCKYGSYVSKYKEVFKRHLSLHENLDNVELFKCEICSYKTKDKRYLKRHSLAHKTNEEVHVYLCEKKKNEKLKYNSKIPKSLEEVRKSNDYCNTEEQTENSISVILSANFQSLSLERKIKIKILGRPTPELNITHLDKIGSRTRHFSKEIYNKFNWICGCDKVNALFCFPCVLFYSECMDETWSLIGFKYLKYLNGRARKHEKSVHHMNSCTELALLGSVSSRVPLDSNYRQKIIKHEDVTRNRYMLKRLISCIMFSRIFDPANDKTDLLCENEGILGDLVDFSSEMNIILRDHCNTATIFKETTQTIQNEILESMLYVCRQEIKNQIDSSDFLAIECDETTDISNQYQMVMILRYYYNGNIYERFWSFLKGAATTDICLTQCIEDELEKLIPTSPLKLIAQTYDSAIVMASGVGSVQGKIKEKYKNAHYVHCYAHQINSIIPHALSIHTNVKIFFCNLCAISDFFSHKCDILEEIVRRKLPGVPVTCWNIKTVNVIFENRDKLIECCQEIEENCKKTIIYKEAHGLRKTLEDSDFVFWLKLFHKLFPHVEVLFHTFQARNKESVEFHKIIQGFEQNVALIRDCIDQIVPESEITNENTSKKREIARIAKEVCAAVTFLVKEKLSYRGHLLATLLVDSDNFLNYSYTFPILTFKAVIECYPVLNQEKLKTELQVFYSRRDKNIKGALNMLSWLEVNSLMEIFSETVKLLRIIVTTPMPTTELELCFSTPEKVKIFLRSTISQERLNALAMLLINKDLIHNIDSFVDKVMQHFISQNYREHDFFV